MNIADFNIRATPPQRSRRVRKDLGLAMALGLQVYCWQELGKWKRYIRILKSVFTEDRWLHLFEKHRNLITVRRKTHSVHGKKTRVLSKAAPWIPQPRRVANAALLRERKTETYEWVVNFHLTNDKAGRRHPLTKTARRRRWFQEVAELTAFVRELQALEDCPIWLCADANSGKMPRLHPDQVDLISRAPMHVSVVNPRSLQHEVRDIPEKRLNTDHAALIVEDR